jgi:hypothetical protein
MEYLTKSEGLIALTLKALQDCFAAGLNDPLTEDGNLLFLGDSFVAAIQKYPGRVKYFIEAAIPYCIGLSNSLLADYLSRRANDSSLLSLLQVVLQYRPGFLKSSEVVVLARWVSSGCSPALKALLASGIEGLKENANLLATLDKDGADWIGNAASIAAFKGNWEALRLLIQYADIDLDAAYAGPMKPKQKPLPSASALLRTAPDGPEKTKTLLAIKAAARAKATKAAIAATTQVRGTKEEDFGQLAALVEEEAKEAAALAQAQAEKARKKKGGKKAATTPGVEAEASKNDGGVVTGHPATGREEEKSKDVSSAAVSANGQGTSESNGSEKNAGAGFPVSSGTTPGLVTAVVAGTASSSQKPAEASSAAAATLLPLRAKEAQGAGTVANVAAPLAQATQKGAGCPKPLAAGKPARNTGPSSNNTKSSIMPGRSPTSTAPDLQETSSSAAPGPIELAKERHARANAAKLGLRRAEPFSYSPLSEEEQLERALRASLADAGHENGSTAAGAGTVSTSWAWEASTPAVHLSPPVAVAAAPSPSPAFLEAVPPKTATHQRDDDGSSNNSSITDQCCICFGSFLSSIALDRVTLHDDHSFCRDCLAGYVENVVRKAAEQGKEARTIECPLCRQGYSLDHARSVCVSKQEPPKEVESPSSESAASAAGPSITALATAAKEQAALPEPPPAPAVPAAIGGTSAVDPSGPLPEAALLVPSAAIAPEVLGSAASILKALTAARLAAVHTGQQALQSAAERYQALPLMDLGDALLQGRPVVFVVGGFTVTLAPTPPQPFFAP